MGELGELFERLHGAGRFRTVHARVRVWSHHEHAMAAWEAIPTGEGMGFSESIISYAPLEEPDEPEPESEHVVELWADGVDRIRTERFASNGEREHVGV